MLKWSLSILYAPHTTHTYILFTPPSLYSIQVEPKLTDTPPPNFKFQQHDVQMGMKSYYGQFDFVQSRMMVGGVKDLHLYSVM